MSEFNLIENPHRRFNPLTGEWVLVSPHRTQRPWQGKLENTPSLKRPEYDPKCYLCPGNERAGGIKNPDYKNTFVFTNDFAAILPDTKTISMEENPLIKAEQINGTSRVICFSPRHDLTLPEMEIDDINKVIQLWMDETSELGKKYKWIQIFENKGEIMGCSNPHPHGQIWAGSSLPNEARKENTNQKIYFEQYKRLMLADYLEYELNVKERIVTENSEWAVIVPFWAVWPFETILVPKKNISRITDLSSPQQIGLANILKVLTIKYDNLFNISFPYTMGWHGAPFEEEADKYWQLHAHFYPPLLRSATVKKFMVGYEMLSEAQRDITPEQAADRLRKLPDIHYKIQKGE